MNSGKVLIVHHVKPYHLDDYLAVSLLMYKYSKLGYEVERREVRDEKELENIITTESNKYDKIIVVDIGKKYQITEKVAYYDHHHDANTPCSLVLVLKHEFPELYEKIQRIEPLRRLVEYIDLRDRFGEKKADETLGIVEPFPLIRMLTAILMTEPSPQVGENFVRLVESYAKVIETTEVYRVNDITVAVNRADSREVPVSIIADVLSPDIIIQKNVRDPEAISVVKNQYSEKYDKIDLERLKTKYAVTFIHPTKFMAVIKMKIEDVTKEVVEDIVRTVYTS